MLLRPFVILIAFASVAAAQTSTPAPAPDLARNPAPSVTPLDPKLPTVFIAGDSTAARGKGESQQGWAVPFADYFDSSKANVANRARGGRSSRTFVTGPEWDGLVADLKTGDIVLIQFGHNDGGALNDGPPPPLRARGSIHGLGEETKEIDNVLTKKHEVVHTYGWYMRKMIADVKAKGATPIVVGLTVRNVWKDGRIERGPGRYNEWSRELAKTAGIPFLDLSNAIADEFEAMGPDKTAALYPQDHTHFNAAGADRHARAVVAALKALPQSPVTSLLSEKGRGVAPAPKSVVLP